MRASTVRKFALALPEAEERETWGTATFRVRNKIFTMFSEGEKDAWVKSTADEQQALIAMYPKTFFFPPYVGPSGWIGVHVAMVDREEMFELVTEAWRLTAPKRVVAAFDEGAPATP
ncbi:MAG: MmcQ/YjbR family DNA-binding protein [Actinomycetota bacterium]